jgi:molybdopterin synthase sulfur carrier subunit
LPPEQRLKFIFSPNKRAGFIPLTAEGSLRAITNNNITEKRQYLLMKVEILLFGRLTELLGHSRLQLEDMADTNSVTKCLLDQCPALQHINYQIAVNQEVIHGNKLLTDGMTVALMPPFSGG